MKDTLIIFAKNEIKGSVKTRLAATVGEEDALRIYRQLLRYTYLQARDLKQRKEVWYSRFLPENDVFEDPDSGFVKKVQQGKDLGGRMKNAFESHFKGSEAGKAVIIGTDCADISTEILQQAFYELENTDVVLGPAKDGGYYLLGMRTFRPELFEGIDWSTGRVLIQTTQKISDLGLDHQLLETLNDVDTIEDWKEVEAYFKPPVI